jgi:RNA polymerase-binding transcription factor DksA
MITIVTEFQMLRHRTEALHRMVRDPMRFAEATDALRRMDDGTYGFCLACWLRIPEAELEQRPERRYCSGCEPR